MRFVFFILICLLPGMSTAAEKVDQAQALHLLNRITYGPSPFMMAEVKRMGIGAFIQQQLHPENLRLPQLDEALSKYHTTSMSLYQLADQYLPEEKNMSEDQKKANRERAKIIIQEMQDAKLMRAVYSSAQLQELMVDFWYNHFNVFDEKEADRVLVGTYERDAIRPYAMGNFSNLFKATAKHPAMLYYLDNWLNTAPGSREAKGRFNGINENYAREIMELHTMGVDGGYTQQDVTNLARILTGWGLDTSERHQDRAAKISQFAFDPNRHDFTEKTLLNNSIYGSGEDEVDTAINILVRHPSTAHHISYEIAQYFVADDPPESLVNAMAATFSRTNGDIRSVLSTMLYSKEFWNPKYYQNKFKSPLRYVVSAVRISNTPVYDPLALARNIDGMGEPLYHYITPDGYPNTNEHWLNSDAILRRIDFARKVAAGKLDKDDVYGRPLDPLGSTNSMLTVFGNQFSASLKTVSDADPRLRPVLVLSSPEFLYY